MMVELHFSTVVAASPDEVWRRVTTMDGVNAELGPWIRMTHPADRSSLDVPDVPLNEVLFRSWVLLLGVLPLDRHALALERLHQRGFDERSSSWMQKVWIHRRRVEVAEGGARVSDELRFEPRLQLLAPMLRLVIGAIFRHRHRQLVRLFRK